jgi:hypothetical protein
LSEDFVFELQTIAVNIAAAEADSIPFSSPILRVREHLLRVPCSFILVERLLVLESGDGRERHQDRFVPGSGLLHAMLRAAIVDEIELHVATATKLLKLQLILETEYKTLTMDK